MSVSDPSATAARWLTAQLDKSEAADVKRCWLSWHAADTDTPYNSEDPLRAHAIFDGTDAQTLSELLWRARLTALDERTLWGVMGTCVVSRRVRAVVDGWTEQLAVKLACGFAEELQRCHPGDPAWAALRTAIDAYAEAAIKPQGSATVTDVSAADATVVEAWSDRVARVPMGTCDGVSEGSLRCAAPVPSLGTLLQVPRSAMFFMDTLRLHCALGRAITGEPALRELSSNEEAMLVLCLVYERFVVGATASHWAPLLAHCPLRYPTMPITWELADLAELDGLDMLDDVIAKRNQLQTFADQLQDSLLELLHQALSSLGDGAAAVPSMAELSSAFVWENLAWAQSTFDSRAFNLNVDGAVVVALVPLADMVNHANRTDVLVRRVEPHGGPFTMQVGAALTAADVGRELWMSYGPLQDWQLLQHYGFVLGGGNEQNVLPFPFVAPAGAGVAVDTLTTQAEEGDVNSDTADQHHRSWDARRAALVRRFALWLPGRCWVPHDGVPPAALLALLRVQLAEAEEFPLMETRRYGPLEPLSPATEAAVVTAVRETVEGVVASFPTTLAEDEEALAELRAESASDDPDSDDPTRNYVLCVQLRIGLKQIAARALAWCARQPCTA